jgi:hypothetical protein
MNQKKLNLSAIAKENKKFDQKKKVTLSDEYYVNIYINFSPLKIAELIRETLTDPQKAKEAGINFDNISIPDWGLFNIIYKFTDLGIPTDIKSKVAAYIEIMNSEYWTKIIESFPEESINKIKESLDRFSANFEKLTQEEIEQSLEKES